MQPVEMSNVKEKKTKSSTGNRERIKIQLKRGKKRKFSDMSANGRPAKMLYKAILRLHRSLPIDIQVMGNEYVRNEFKRHKVCKPAEAQKFLEEWANYAVDLAKQIRLTAINKSQEPLGKNLDPNGLDHFRDEQVVQLYELMQASKGTKTVNDAKTDHSSSKE